MGVLWALGTFFCLYRFWITATLHKAIGWERHCVGRALRRWVGAAYALGAEGLRGIDLLKAWDVGSKSHNAGEVASGLVLGLGSADWIG